MIHVLATIEVTAGRRDEFLAHFRQVMPLVRQEAGCLEYGPAVDVATGIAVQAPIRPDVVTVIEKWESLAHLQRHLGAAHMLEYRVKVKPLVASVSLRILEPAD